MSITKNQFCISSIDYRPPTPQTPTFPSSQVPLKFQTESPKSDDKEF